jgi:multidrug efflux system membrane fusion protein
VTLRNVTAGISGVDDVEITKGLAVGEQVVTEGGDRLKDGATIQTSADRPAGAATSAGKGGRGARAPGGAAAPPAATPGDATAPAANGAARPRGNRGSGAPRTSP